MAVTIIDAPCGAGKTEYAIAYMNAHPENSFIFREGCRPKAMSPGGAARCFSPS